MSEIHEKNSFLWYVNFVLIGFCFLTPWNSVLASIYYFKDKFVGIKVEFYITFPCYAAVFLFSILIFPMSNKISFHSRMHLCFICLIISMILLPILSQIFPNDFGFWIFVLLVFVANSFTTIMQTSIYGIGSVLSNKLLR